MNSISISCTIATCMFGSALFGMMLRIMLPQHHFSDKSQDIVKLGAGLIGSMAALLLGLLVASAKGSYDTDKAELTQMSSKVIVLDRLLALYGPEAHEARVLLRNAVVRTMRRIWPEQNSQSADNDPGVSTGGLMYSAIQQLTPKNDQQRGLKSDCLSIALDLAQMRWLLYEQSESSISMTFLVVVVFWLMVIFLTFGLFSPRNATVIATLFLCALSVAGAIFLILELDEPFRGMIRISSEPLSRAVEHLGK